MKIGWGKRLAVVIAGTMAIGAPSETATAQPTTARSGLEITGSVRFGVDVDDNASLDDPSPGTDTRLSTDLEIGITSERDFSSLNLSFGATLQTEDQAGRPNDDGFTNQFVNLDYVLQGPSNRLTIDGLYQRRDLEDFFFDDPATVNDRDFVIDGGTLDITDFNAVFDAGITRPLGATLTYNYRDRSYDDTTDPSLADNQTHLFRAAGVARPSQVLTFNTFVEYESYESDEAARIDRETTRVGVGIDYDVNPVTTLTGDFFYEDVDEDFLFMGLPANVQNDGFAFDAGVTRVVPDGAYSVTLRRQITTFTKVSEIRAGRALDLPDGALGVELGLSDTDNTDPEIIGALRYQYDTPRGPLVARLEREAIVNNQNEIRVREFGRLSYDYELTPIDSVLFGAEYARSEITGPIGVDDTTNAQIDVTYRRQVNQDWDVQVGYRGRYRDEIGISSATSNAFILSFGRSFSVRP